MQLEAMEAARLQDANAAQDEIAASEKAKQELQNQLEEAQQLLRQQQAEIRALKTKTPQNIGHSSSLCRGARRQGSAESVQEGEKTKLKEDSSESAECSRLRMALRSKDRQLRILQSELTELRQQHIQVQQQSEKQQQELLKLAQRLEVLRKSKASFEAKATRTALALDAAYAHLRTEREEKAFLLRLVDPHHAGDGIKATSKAHGQPLREGTFPEAPLKRLSEIGAKQNATEQVAARSQTTESHSRFIARFRRDRYGEPPAPPTVIPAVQGSDKFCSTQAGEGTKTESDELCSIEECKSAALARTFA
ncbi:hypothetical protein, conserved [Eimeria acervulina]|uniref:Uncharacterized protein n=1 Tax=Eimeria acervulina TaxID=5801 RepID=U6GRP1_EIMAC|nr:hypothetical protein, conserved [Eimeria acervulina]CDI82232.1 hypothetical protein, conserved [Eimeria acervulina]